MLTNDNKKILNGLKKKKKPLDQNAKKESKKKKLSKMRVQKVRVDSIITAFKLHLNYVHNLTSNISLSVKDISFKQQKF